MEIRHLLVQLAIGACIACSADRVDSPAAAQATLPPSDQAATAAAQRAEWRVRPLEFAPPRFRPGGWSDETVLWGLVGDRLTRLDVATRAVKTLTARAWSLEAAQNVVSWRNGSGTWMLREPGEPVRLAGPEPDPRTGFDGPPTLVWSRDGTRALMRWQGEWDAHYVLLESDGTRRDIELKTSGYFGNAAVLWLDSDRVLFQTVANAPLGGEPTYRESGWRGDLAVFDLSTGRYTPVTAVPDFTFLRIGGFYGQEVLVTEYDDKGPKSHWLYDTRTWNHRAAPFPKGRAFASPAGAAVILTPSDSDLAEATLSAEDVAIPIGAVAPDAEPVFSPRGTKGSVRVGTTVMLLEGVDD